MSTTTTDHTHVLLYTRRIAQTHTTAAKVSVLLRAVTAVCDVSRWRRRGRRRQYRLRTNSAGSGGGRALSATTNEHLRARTPAGHSLAPSPPVQSNSARLLASPLTPRPSSQPPLTSHVTPPPTHANATAATAVTAAVGVLYIRA